MIQIELNGEQREIPGDFTVARLIEELDLTNRAIAVERNGQIVSRQQFAACRLGPGDSLEIVTLVGGG